MADNKLKYKVLYSFLVFSFLFNSNKEGYCYNLSMANPPYLSYTEKDIIEKIISDDIFYTNHVPGLKMNNSILKEESEKAGHIIQKIDDLVEKTRLNIVKYEEHTFEITFYTDLNCENGFGNLAATGEVLEDGMIANNFLDFGTNVYIEGYGLKTVKDRGSKKYFKTVDNVDIFIPRNYGEGDEEYYRRVNDMGRRKVKGYVLYLGE